MCDFARLSKLHSLLRIIGGESLSSQQLTVISKRPLQSNWTLHSTPDSAQPSWRLITALRLYHLAVTVGSADEDAIQPWRDVVTGKRCRVSSENEQSWRKTVVLLCDMLIKRAEKYIALDSTQNKHKEDTWARWMLENIQSLWREEVFVAKAVRESMLRGDEF